MAKSGRFLIGTLLGAALAMGASAQSASTSSTAQSTTTQSVSLPANPAPQKDAISKAAALYGTYQGAVTDFKQTPFGSTKDIDRALDELGSHNSEQLSKGWLSYSALVASQNPEFRAAINESISHYGRDRILLGMQENYAYARTLKGGNSAVGSALTAIDADARRLLSTGRIVKEQAYTLQSAKWARKKVGNGEKKADGIMAKTRIGVPVRGNVMSAMIDVNANNNFAKAGGSGAPSLWDGISSAASTVRFPSISTVRGSSYKRVRAGQEQTADRIATLAAYRAAGAGSSAESAVLTAMSDKGASRCINKANLYLQQCVAAAHTYDELPFCIADYSLTEIGQCIGKVAQ